MIKIKNSTFNFLNQLATNNNRDWFLENKLLYEESKQNVEEFTDGVLDLIREFDTSIPKNLKAKQCMLRIYRDVRFSKNKTPYKSNFGISISSSGKGTNRPGYYLNIEPNNCFIAGGYWLPNPKDLSAIRQEIDYNSTEFLKIVDSKSFKSYFGELDKTDSLKLTPKGYDNDNPNIKWLKLKSFIGVRNISDELMTSDKLEQELKEGVALICPLIAFLQNALD